MHSLCSCDLLARLVFALWLFFALSLAPGELDTIAQWLSFVRSLGSHAFFMGARSIPPLEVCSQFAFRSPSVCA